MEKIKLLELKHLLSLIVLMGLFFSCSQEPVEEFSLETADLVVEQPDIIKNHYIVILSKQPVKKDPRSAVALEAISKEVGRMPGAKVNAKFRHSITGFSARLNKGQLKKLEKDPRVISIEPDRIIKLEAFNSTNIVSVQEYPTWGLDRIDQRGGKLDRAYSHTARGAGVDVYIMDSGIRYSHSEFNGRAKLGVDLVELYPDPEYDITDPEVGLGEDCHGHGTHVAGTVGGNQFGVAKGVNLISVRVFSCVGITSESRVVKAVDWITEQAGLEENAGRPAVVNMSLGGNPYEPLELAVQNSIATGIHYVLAAGNGDMDACNYSPARVSGALTVGASDFLNNRVYFSNFGDCVDLYAPGEEITSAGIGDDTAIRLSSGTSMAAPHVAGLVALYLEKHPEATPAEVHTAIVENSTIDAVENVPSGTNNLAFTHWDPVEFTPPTPPDLNFKVFGITEKSRTDVYLVWQPTESRYIDIYKNGVFYNTVGNIGQLKLRSGRNSKDVFQICETSYENCSEALAPNYELGDFKPNVPPTASFLYTVNGMEVQFSDTSVDEDGSIIDWRWDLGNGDYLAEQHPTYTYSEPGTYTVTLFAFDNYHEQNYFQQVITITGEGVETPPTADFSYSIEGLSVQFQDFSSDIGGTITGWQWDFGDGNISSVQNPLHTYSEAGDYIISLTVTDDSGETNIVSKEVSVYAASPIILSATGGKVKGKWQADLKWTTEGISGLVDIYRDGNLIATVDNSGEYRDETNIKGGGEVTYVVCESGSSFTCSNEVRLQF